MSKRMDMSGEEMGKNTEERKAIRLEKLRQSREERNAAEPVPPPATETRPDDKTLSLIKCVSCFKIPFPTQHFICTDGHVVCKTCAPKIKRCTSEVPGLNENIICYRPMVRVKEPLDLFETIYKEGLWRCSYFEAGCTQRHPGSEIVQHITNCDFRPSHPCAIPTCGALLDTARILGRHLSRSHDIPFAESSTKTFHCSYDPHFCSSEARGKRFPQLLETFSTHFLVVVEERKVDLKIGIWHFGGDLKASSVSAGFQYRLVIHGKASNKTNYKEWTGRTVQLPNRETQKTIGPGANAEDEEGFFTINKKVFEKNYLKRHKQFLYWTAAILIQDKVGANSSSRPMLQSDMLEESFIPETDVILKVDCTNCVDVGIQEASSNVPVESTSEMCTDEDTIAVPSGNLNLPESFANENQAAAVNNVNMQNIKEEPLELDTDSSEMDSNDSDHSDDSIITIVPNHFQGLPGIPTNRVSIRDLYLAFLSCEVEQGRQDSNL